MYFFKSEKAGNRVRCRAIVGQTLDGEHLNTQLYLYCDEEARTKNPIGTIFAVEKVTFAAGFYQASPKTITPVTGPNAIAFSKEVTEYEKFLDGTNTGAKSATPKPRGAKTRVEVLLNTCPQPEISKDGYYVDAAAWVDILLQIDSKENTVITGPTGSAKTEIVELLAAKFNKKLHIFDMATQQDPVSGLCGVHRLNEKGESYFDFAKFAKVIQEPDTWILLDEINRAPLSANNLLFPLTDRRRTLELALASSTGARDIKVHPDVLFFATANLGAEYTGTNSMDRALIDRFSPVEFDYPPTDKEAEILNHRTAKLDTSEAKKIVTICDKLRSSAREGDISTAPSVRHSLRLADRVVKGLPLTEALKSVVLPLYSRDERETVKAVISGLLK